MGRFIAFFFHIGAQGGGCDYLVEPACVSKGDELKGRVFDSVDEIVEYGLRVAVRLTRCSPNDIEAIKLYKIHVIDLQSVSVVVDDDAFSLFQKAPEPTRAKIIMLSKQLFENKS